MNLVLASNAARTVFWVSPMDMLMVVVCEHTLAYCSKVYSGYLCSRSCTGSRLECRPCLNLRASPLCGSIPTIVAS